MTTWADVDLTGTVAAVLNGTHERPTPTLGRIVGAGALLYPGKVHGVHGVGGAGKTWLAACILAERLLEGEHVMLVDLEDTPETIVERLVVDLQVPAAAILDRFHYVRPTEPTRVGLSALHRTVTDHHITLVVLDSVGEALAVDGVRQNEDAEVAAWFARFARSTADLGAAVLLLDHVPKADERSLYPIGSQRKQAAMNGVIYSLQRLTPFSRDVAGSAALVVGKDRQGTYAHGQRVAELRVTPLGDRSLVELVAPAPKTDSFEPTGLMEKVSRALEAAGEPLSFSGICERARGKRTYLHAAVAALIEHGHVTTSPGPRRSTLHTLVRPYRETPAVVPEQTGGTDPGLVVPVPVPLRGERWEPLTSSSREPLGTTGNHWDSEGTYPMGPVS